MNFRKFLLLGISFISLTGYSGGDDWGAPEPASFHSRGFSYVAEIFPPKSRQNATDKPICYFYSSGYSGTSWEIIASVLWKGPLAEDPFQAPYNAVVSMQGDLVVMYEYAQTVAVYGGQGQLVGNYSLSQLLPSVPLSHWSFSAKYYFLENPGRFYLVLAQGTVIRFQLSDGQHASGPASNFPELTKVAANQFANEQAEVWRTSLRFSSITDVLAARESHK